MLQQIKYLRCAWSDWSHEIRHEYNFCGKAQHAVMIIVSVTIGNWRS